MEQKETGRVGRVKCGDFYQAFRPPTPLSDEDDNGAPADHLIGHGDAVWTAISDDRPP
jgi:hypothetical protein